MLHPTPRPKDDYPYYDGEPMSESDWHYRAIVYLKQALEKHFADRPDVYVAANMFVYYVEGDRDQKVSPDVFVCFGAERRDRASYKTWEDTVPWAVFEITSESSRLTDMGEKRARYALMGVKEYYLFDPLAEYLPGQFRAYRREGEDLVPVVAGPRFHSEALGVEMAVEGSLLRLYDAASTHPYPTAEELEASLAREQARAEQEAARAEQEAARRRELEEEVRRLRRALGDE